MRRCAPGILGLRSGATASANPSNCIVHGGCRRPLEAAGGQSQLQAVNRACRAALYQQRSEWACAVFVPAAMPLPCVFGMEVGMKWCEVSTSQKFTTVDLALARASLVSRSNSPPRACLVFGIRGLVEAVSVKEQEVDQSMSQ